MPDIFHVNRRTIFKDISKGIEALTALLYGIDGVPGLQAESFPQREEIAGKVKETLQRTLPSEIREEVKKIVRII